MPAKTGGATPSSQGSSKLTISLGLVNVPVVLKTIERSSKQTKVGANYICPVHRERTRQPKWCDSCNAQVDAVKAYDVDGVFYELDEQTLEGIVADKTGEMQVKAVVEFAAIDPFYLDQDFEVWAGEGGAATHDLLAAALRESGQAIVGQAVLTRSKTTRLLVVRWSEATGTLVAHSCRYEETIRWDELRLIADGIKSRPAPPKEQVQLAGQILAASAGEFNPEAVTDSYTEALREALVQLAAGQPAPKPKPKPQADVVDLMDALRASVEAAKGGQAKKPAAKKPAARKPRAKAA